MAKILIVDDSSDIRKLIRAALRAGEHDIHEASNGIEAIETLKDKSIDLLILDIFMPERDGLETLREINRMNLDVGIIAMSGGGQIDSKGYLDMAKKLGASITLSKPFTIKEIRDAVKSFL